MLRNGSPVKQWAEIISSHPPSKQIHGQLRDGGKIVISVFEIPVGFRWPQEGEIWSVMRDSLSGTTWELGSRIHNEHEETAAIDTMVPGELRLDATHITNALGNPLKEVYIQPDEPDVDGPYLWIETVADGSWTLWFHDGT